MAELRQARLCTAETAPVTSLHGHPWTQSPLSVAFDEGLIRQDARDQLMHQNPLNANRQLGAARVYGNALVAVSVEATPFSRPCVPILVLEGAGTYTAVEGAWRLRHVRQEHPVLNMQRASAEVRRKHGPQPVVHFGSMAWSSRRAGVLTCSVTGLQDGSVGTLRIVDVPNDDSRCVHRLVALPALVRIVSQCEVTATIADLVDLHTALASLNNQLHYTAVVGVRRPEWLLETEWQRWLARIVDKGVPPSYDHLPPSIGGTLYDSLCLALGAAACADAWGTPLLHRGLVSLPAADALRAHMDAVTTDGIEHTAYLERYDGCEGRWRDAAVNIVKQLCSEAENALATVVSECSGQSSKGAVLDKCAAKGVSDGKGAVIVKNKDASNDTNDEDAILLELQTTPAPWAPLTRSSAVTTWMQSHWEAWHRLPFVACTSFCMVDMLTGEVVSLEARPPPGWQPVCKGVPGSPVWLQGTDGALFPWDCRSVPEGVLLYAQRRPDTLVPYPCMVVEGSVAVRPALPSTDQVCFQNSYAILAAAFNLPLYGSLRLVDGTVSKVDPATGWAHPMTIPPRLPPALLAKWALGPDGALVAVGTDGCARAIPCRPYRLALEAMDVDSVRFYPMRDGKLVSELSLAVYDAILERRKDAMQMCNVACTPAVADMVWSPQPASVEFEKQHDRVRVRLTPIPPVHRPFIAVSNAAGEVIQIVDEIMGAPPLFRKAGHCSAMYCPHPRVHDNLYCVVHACSYLPC